MDPQRVPYVLRSRYDAWTSLRHGAGALLNPSWDLGDVRRGVDPVHTIQVAGQAEPHPGALGAARLLAR